MTLRIKPTAEQLEQLRQCTEIDGDKLEDLALEFDKLDDVPLVPDRLLEEIKKKLDSKMSEVLLRQLLSLSMKARKSDIRPRDIVKAMRQALEEQNLSSQWDRIASPFQMLLESKPVRLVTKAMELSYDYANLLQNARILTDLRPFFDESGDQVEGAVVTQTLRIGFRSDDGPHELSLALDLQDIKKLREQCDRAITKAKSIHSEFTSSTMKPCLISGENEGDV